MSKDMLGRHWKFDSKGPAFRLYETAQRRKAGQNEISASVDAIPAKEGCKCGGNLHKAAGIPRIHGEWLMCGKCGVEIRRFEER